jgi:hypothetical protein
MKDRNYNERRQGQSQMSEATIKGFLLGDYILSAIFFSTQATANLSPTSTQKNPQKVQLGNLPLDLKKLFIGSFLKKNS